jgi:hypothetical protein
MNSKPSQGQAWFLKPVILATWEADMGDLSTRLAWGKSSQNLISAKG